MTGITGATTISTGSFHSCALLIDATIKCWGMNAQGQLGNATNTSSRTPVTVAEAGAAILVTSGDAYSCAWLANSSIRCWGYNIYGQLGNGTNTDSNIPVSVIGL